MMTEVRDSQKEGLAAVRRGGQWGFVNKEGEEVVPCRYDEVPGF